MKLKKVLALVLLSLVLLTSQVFATASDYGYYIGTLINGDLYDRNDYYLLDFDGIYYDFDFYKEALNLEIVEQEAGFDVNFKGTKVLSFTKEDQFAMTDEFELPVFAESEDDTPFVLFEFIADALGEDLSYKWETINENGVTTYKQVIITASEELTGSTNITPLASSFKPKTTKDMKNTMSYIKKLTKKPSVTASEIKFTDKQCTVITTLNMTPGSGLDKDVNFTVTGKLSTEAINLLNVILKDLVEAKDIKPMVDTMKRLTNVAVAPQTDRKTYDKLLKGPYYPWSTLGDYFKYMAKFEIVEKKTYVEIYLTDYYTDTYDYND